MMTDAFEALRAFAWKFGFFETEFAIVHDGLGTMGSGVVGAA